MMKFFSVVCLVYVAQVHARGIDDTEDHEAMPEVCRHPPNTENAQQCCQAPELFSKEEVKTCNLDHPVPELVAARKMNEEQMKVFQRISCKRNECLLKSHGLMASSGIINREKASHMLEDHARKNPIFQKAVLAASAKCLPASGPIPGHRDFCEPIRFFVCLSTMVYSDCPAGYWVKDELCDAVKTYLKTCKRYVLY